MRVIVLLLLVVTASGCAIKVPMVASPTGDGKYWVLREPLEYEHPKTKEKVVAPRGFVTDLASVPRLFWTAFPPCGKYTSAAVIHDYLYWVQPTTCDRKCADDILLTAMEESNVNFATRNAIYRSVRAGGQSSWDRNQRARLEGAIRQIPEEFLNFEPYDTWEQIERRVRRRSVRCKRSAANPC